MVEPKISAMPVAMEDDAGQLSQNVSSLSDLHKAQIRLIALQRNLNALLLQYRDIQQEAAKAEAEFSELRDRVHRETGMLYNDQTLSFESVAK